MLQNSTCLLEQTHTHTHARTNNLASKHSCIECADVDRSLLYSHTNFAAAAAAADAAINIADLNVEVE